MTITNPYFQIVSPTFRISSETTDPIPVGALACQRDPLLKELQSTVISSALSQAGKLQTAFSSRKSSKKDKSQSSTPQEPLLEVILHDTILFPEGGGQPHDIGVLKTAEGEEWDVVDVKRIGGHAIHYVAVKKDRNVDDALSLFAPGSSVTALLGEAGWQRRYDHMCMHTSQHLLSAVLETSLNLPTLSWSLTSSPSPCYVEIPRAISTSEIASIQDEANKYVYEGRQVHVEVEELDRQALPGVAKIENGRSVGKALPDDYTGGVKRTVVIDGVDRNPCCGTHLPSLNNLQLFLLPQTESLSRSSTTSTRLYFLAGPRLITHLTSSHSLLTATSSIMSCGTPQVPERVEQVVEDRKRATKRVEDLEQELAAGIAKDILTSAENLSKNGTILAHRHRIDDSPNPLGFLSSISMAFSSQKNIPSKYLVVLTSSPSSQSASSITTVLVFGDENAVKAVGNDLKSKLGVKGGGKGTRWSGKFVGVWKEAKENGIVREISDGLEM